MWYKECIISVPVLLNFSSVVSKVINVIAASFLWPFLSARKKSMINTQPLMYGHLYIYVDQIY